VEFLETLQKMISGFVFSVRFDYQGLPDAFMYMTPRMRMDLVQFGDVIFLNAQHQQFKSLGSPYISPVLHVDKGKIAQGAESIVIEESHEIYAWVLSKMARLELWFRLDQIWINICQHGDNQHSSSPVVNP
jgi:hypothetical protein